MSQVLEGLLHFSPLGTFIGAAVAAVGLWVKVRQDGKDLRRKQAEVARLVYNDLHQDEYSMAAMLMLDYQGWRHTTKDFDKIEISYDDVKLALSVQHASKRPDKELLVRRAFDSLFAKLENVMSLADGKVGLVLWTDFAALFGYYVFLMRQDPYAELLSTYARSFGFMKIVDLIADEDGYPVVITDDLKRTVLMIAALLGPRKPADLLREE